MRAVKWISGVFVIGVLVALACFASTSLMIGANPEWEVLFFLIILIAFTGVAISATLLLIIVPRVLHERIQKNKSVQDQQATPLSVRCRWARFAIALSFLIGIAFWGFYSVAVYDACLDRIHYDKSRWHECD